MSKAIFQAKLTLQAVTPLDGEMKEWSCDVLFADADGAFTGYDIIVNDVMAVDTGGMEAGSFTFFKVTTITSQDFSSASFNVIYTDSNDNAFGPPDLSAFTYTDCVISRPSTNYGLLPVISRDLQVMSDKFTEYVQNYNFVQIVDKISSNQTFLKINDDSITLFKGMPVVVRETNTNFVVRASANTHENAQVIGVVSDLSILISSAGAIVSKGLIEQATHLWDSLTGEIDGLIGGKDYFLRNDVSGGITRFPPETGFVVKIGKAISATMLSVDVEPPIEL